LIEWKTITFNNLIVPFIHAIITLKENLRHTKNIGIWKGTIWYICKCWNHMLWVWDHKRKSLAFITSSALFFTWASTNQMSNTYGVATPLWPSVGVKPNTWKSWRLGVFRDSRMFRARQQGAKHLALGCSWCHWKGLET
jgi:hypothetical protein